MEKLNLSLEWIERLRYVFIVQECYAFFGLDYDYYFNNIHFGFIFSFAFIRNRFRVGSEGANVGIADNYGN